MYKVLGALYVDKQLVSTQYLQRGSGSVSVHRFYGATSP